MRRPDPAFWRGRRVLVTGHTGFKGAWLTLMLRHLGADLVGIALDPEPGPGLFSLIAPTASMEHHVVDVRDRDRLVACVRNARPSIVFHLAAQALVRRSYLDPAATFAVNVGGTVNLLDALRNLNGVEAALIVTSDKVYRNEGAGRPFVEADPLGGDDPYSASKAAAEIAVASWRAAFGRELPRVVTARAGNVIGGGDFAEDRLVPDIVRAVCAGEPLRVRYPNARRPWQHVLDALSGYLLFVEHIFKSNGPQPHAFNFGPNGGDGMTVSEFIERFGSALGKTPAWHAARDCLPEATTLALDPGLAISTLKWTPRLNASEAIRATAEWYTAWQRGEDMARFSTAAVAEALA